MKKTFIIVSFFLVFALLFVACSQKPEIDLSKTVGNTEDYFRKLDEISITTSSYSVNKKEIKFRLMVETPPSQKEAKALFEKIVHTLEKHSHTQELWNYYNGYFDIKTYDDGVIYEATKLLGEDLKTISE